MITFNFTGKKIYQENEKSDAQDHFIKVLGDFNKEFDKANVFVTINTDLEGNKRYSFNSKEDIGVLIGRFQEFTKSNSSHSLY